ncbi:unnamed protein product [Protopolystoma xenopodis]|uniref:Uncharacterized protein n=1 Tax=Protopolystoma xenopodis TaxID=117903 RepID=A0A448WFS9_9PLAT|nr:unnamed protein product [Protopolystoma xenopodis]
MTAASKGHVPQSSGRVKAIQPASCSYSRTSVAPGTDFSTPLSRMMPISTEYWCSALARLIETSRAGAGVQLIDATCIEKAEFPTDFASAIATTASTVSAANEFLSTPSHAVPSGSATASNSGIRHVFLTN